MNSFSMGNLNVNPFSFETLFKTRDISRRTQEHLRNVYACLALMVACASFATYSYITTGLLRGSEGVCQFGLFGVLLYLAFASDVDSPKGVVCLGVFGFLKGIVLAPLCQASLQIDPSILATAFIATTAIFTMFSLAAMYARRRSYLFLG